MLLEQFSDSLLDKNITTKFEWITLSDIDKKINAYKLVDEKNLILADTTYYNERVITIEEFRQETTLALIFKFTSDVLYADLHLAEDKANEIIEKLAEESMKDEYAKLFDGYVPYWELILANDTNKQFAMIDNAKLPDEYYEGVFMNLSEIFYNIIESMGYQSTTSPVNTKTMMETDLVQ